MTKESVAVLAIFLFPISFALFLVFVVSGNGNYGENAITDPLRGRVYLCGDCGVGDYKYCSGTTLIYSIDRGGNAVPNSPECAR